VRDWAGDSKQSADRQAGGGSEGKEGAMNRPLWRWWLWCVLNELSIRVRWRWVWRAWQWAIVPAWLGDGGADCGEEEPF
jgi:hypothetical protein